MGAAQVVKKVFVGDDNNDKVSFKRTGPYELIDSMKKRKIDAAIFFRDLTAPNLSVETLLRQAVVHNILRATTPDEAAGALLLLLAEALPAVEKDETRTQKRLLAVNLRKNSPALEKYDKQRTTVEKKKQKGGGRIHRHRQSRAVVVLRPPHIVEVR